MGGYVAFEILRRAPERVTRLALLDTQARADSATASARRHQLMALAEQGSFRGVTPRLLPMFIHPDRLQDAELCATVQAMAEDTGKEGFLRQQTAILGRPDSRPACRRSPARPSSWPAATTPSPRPSCSSRWRR